MVPVCNDYIINDDLVFKSRVKKKQIILINTGYPINDYLTKITLRYNKKYNKVPTYTIDRSGKLYQHFDPKNYTELFDDDAFNKAAITIALENVGWLEFMGDKNVYLDWRGHGYNNTVIEKNWRNKKFWAEYTNEQMETLFDLLNYLCLEYSIDKNFIGNNVLTDKLVNFKGIFNRSNFSKNHYDLNPAFDFEKLIEIINK